MPIANRITAFMERSSWIRKMFEEGAALKAKLGAENVFDFTLGNPDLSPPPEVEAELLKIIQEKQPMKYGYMPNSGYPETRQAVADYLSTEQQTKVGANAIVMTCGAGGALNVIFKAILNPGDEVIAPRPYFVEYNFYVDNHGGFLKTVATLPDFTLDMDTIEAEITAKTRAVIINSPNNPTGAIFPEAQIKALGELLARKSAETGQTIYLISDEPYRKIIYDGAAVPPIFPFYANSIIANSYSKDLSLAGERIGFLALNPAADDFAQLTSGFLFCNRILGFVNAPGIMQRLVARFQGRSVDISLYQQKRDLLYTGLVEAGFTVAKPAGAFYLFPKSPLEDDVEFVRTLQTFNILAVPGSGFGGPGYFRLAYCIDDASIKRSLPVFKKVGEKFFG
ncbi:MAG: pyridoxal phosphate-dependent aminotransferase [Deltaproteobacteria bacterium]|nr:pyridoxal phosphate-dependent aminotransferase [Candidatus Anaeroferrophillus wilburensis]MBN2888024.1 pyridoxal phosphate-dependent aminotransferase [Deltaproteobacteria bacterium]